MLSRGILVSGKLCLTWQNYEQWMQELVPILHRDHPQLKVVYGPPRGGLIPAVTLSHRLDLKHVQSIDQLRHLRGHSWNSWNEVLWVDEIVDSGKTLQGELDELSTEMVTASWIAREAVVPRFPTLHIHAVFPQSEWVVFPWEDRRRWESERSEYVSRQ